MNEEHTTEQGNDDLEKAVGDLSKVGRIWARHGLTVGASALQTSAATLRTTATFLGRLADGFASAQEAGSEVQDDEPARGDEAERGEA